VRTVLLDPGSYDCLNFGDLAMLQVAVARWNALWPSASVAVLTAAPEALASYSPSAIPVDVRDRAAWLNTHIAGRFHRSLPSPVAARLERLERGLKLDSARALELALAMRRRSSPDHASGRAGFLHWLRHADVVALTGGGALTDAFSVKASQVLDTLAMAVRRNRRHGKPVTAIFGQGFGPLNYPDLRERAAQVLPRIDLIALRENQTSPSLIAQLGARDDRIILTGDDAIELVFDNRSSASGNAIGVNVRVSYYAHTDASTLETVKQAVVAAARRYDAALIPVPISRQRGSAHSHNAEQSDGASIQNLLADTGLQRAGWRQPDSPAGVIRDVGGCRLVVTGSYHGAVFALAQGIPAIGLAASPYYRAKFVGLAEQFPGGVQMVDMAEPGWGERLEGAIDQAWPLTERLRSALLEAAARQIELSRGAYTTVARLAAARTPRVQANVAAHEPGEQRSSASAPLG
jgi:polysaccharide pyruvyl transferase WcaK-like protein